MAVFVKPILHGSVSVGGGNTLASAIGEVYSEFQIYAAIHREEEGDYFVEQNMEFYAHGRLQFGNPMPLQLDGDLSDLDNWEEIAVANEEKETAPELQYASLIPEVKAETSRSGNGPAEILLIGALLLGTASVLRWKGMV